MPFSPDPTLVSPALKPTTEGKASLNRRFCTAPMMDWSDRHCRHFWRQFTRESLLYTEMVTTGAIIHSGTEERFLAYDALEEPIALQLGGSDPQELALCAKKAEGYGYDEVNLNVGCPSDRVQNNRIGACLMAEAEHVKQCLTSMIDAVDIPVTVKHRIGIDDQDSYEFLCDFVGTVAESGCTTFIVHARKAILSGLSPKENREIPPLKYEYVHRLKLDFPHLEIIINGGLNAWDEIQAQLENVDGVMVGRAAYQNPWLLAEVDQRCYGTEFHPQSREAALNNWRTYLESQLALGVPLQHLLRHTLGLFSGLPGGKQYRRIISEQAHKPSATLNVLDQALEAVKTCMKERALAMESR